ncbi:hypothetical protein OHA25_60320 (plasmid) [Nonomuraea sp. NBC_00507]|uniref:hypothetical protein n=1 Tax=Nonomuraea sp. NBC_00507 TaxID=2976002 RepID=UPI002E19E009
MLRITRCRQGALRCWVALSHQMSAHIEKVRCEVAANGERGSESLDKVIWIAVIITAATGAAALLATFIDAKLQGLK